MGRRVRGRAGSSSGPPSAVSAPQRGSGCYAAGAACSLTKSPLHKGDDWPRQWLALDYTSADTQLSEVRQQV